MDRKLTDGGVWFADRTAGAPPVLRQRAGEYFDGADAAPLADRLVAASEAALRAAIGHGESRAAALDLLAADALVTLALLAAAEDGVDHLERTAQRVELRSTS